MNATPLTQAELVLLQGVFRRYPAITAVKLFGSRAKGTHAPNSDIDLALWGEADELLAETLAADLDELPLPYRFDVVSFNRITLNTLREHIERVGIFLYPTSALELGPS